MDFYDIFIRLCAQKGIKPSPMVESIGINKTAVSNWKARKSKPTDANMQKIADFFNVSIDYLNGNSTQNPSFPSPTVTENYTTFPVIGDIAAGYDKLALENWEGDTLDVPNSYLKGRSKEEFFVLRVTGDSMFPTYQDGDKVLILKQSTLNYSGQVGAIMYDGDCATLKKVEYVDGEDWLRMVPINPTHPPKKVEGADLESCRVLGIPKYLFREIKD